MQTVKIVTNNVPRFTIDGFELTDKEKREFEYYSAEDLNNSTFFRYKGHVYDLAEFSRIGKSVAPHPQREGWENWDGYLTDSFFSGILIKFPENNMHSVIVAQYFI